MPTYRLPLAGVRILDLTLVWAGPCATRLLADAGAEVIKVESPRNWDLLRALHFLPPDTPQAYDKSAFFNHNNRNKFGCVLDIGQARGRDLALRLAAISDVVVENLRADGLERLGLGYEALRQARRDIIVVSMPSHGRDGPEAHHIAFGSNIEQLAGLTSLTGYPDGGPHKTGLSYGDPVAGTMAAGAVLAALLHRRRTGEGQHIEVAQWEAMIAMLGEFVVAQGMTGEQPLLLGNRHRSMAPHGVYSCRGEDAWVALAVGSDREFQALCAGIGRPELAREPRFADVVSRHRHQDELDPIIAGWTRERTHREAAEALQSWGLAAAPVLTIPELLEDAHLRAGGFFETVAHPVAGVWDMEGVVWRFGRTPAHVRLPAPCFGEHNDYVFDELLGLSHEEMAALERDGVIGRVPEPETHR